MKSISSFQITGMTLSGFKCYEEPAHLTFGNPTVVTGGNGRGKSSIADASPSPSPGFLFSVSVALTACTVRRIRT